jgi:hypothetical protein
MPIATLEMGRFFVSVGIAAVVDTGQKFHHGHDLRVRRMERYLVVGWVDAAWILY